MNCCLDCIRFLNRKGYQKINGRNSTPRNKLNQIVVIKNDNSKEIYDLNSNANYYSNNKKTYQIDKLSLKELEKITNDEDDIIYDLNNLNNFNKSIPLVNCNKNKKNNQNNQNNESELKTKGIVNNSKNDFYYKNNNNKMKPKNSNDEKLFIRNFNNEKKNKHIKSEIQNKCFDKNTKDKLSDNSDSDEVNEDGFQMLIQKSNTSYSNNLRNRNEGLSDLEWDIIGDEVF